MQAEERRRDLLRENAVTVEAPCTKPSSDDAHPKVVNIVRTFALF